MLQKPERVFFFPVSGAERIVKLLFMFSAVAAGYKETEGKGSQTYGISFESCQTNNVIIMTEFVKQTVER